MSGLSCSQPVTPYSFWLAEPEYYSSSSDLPCSVFYKAAGSFSSSFPSATYKYAANSSYSLTTLAVCTNASIQDFSTIFLNTVTQALTFRSILFHGNAQIVLPNFNNVFFDPTAPYAIQDLFSQFQLAPYSPDSTTSPSQYASCCTDNFCANQLSSSTNMQPYKFLWGSIPSITSSPSQSQKLCQQIMGCTGSLAMAPTSGTSTCSANVYVIQATVGIGWIFRALFLFVLVVDCTILMGISIAVLNAFKYTRASVKNAESAFQALRDPSLEFYQEVYSTGKGEHFETCLKGVTIQWLLDAASMNVFTAAFGQFILLLNSKEQYSTDAIIPMIELHKSTAFGNDQGSYDVVSPARRMTFPKHWKSTALRFKASPGMLLFAFSVDILINIVYPLLSLSSLSSCPSLARSFHIAVFSKTILSFAWSLFCVYKGSRSLSRKISEMQS